MRPGRAFAGASMIALLEASSSFAGPQGKVAPPDVPEPYRVILPPDSVCAARPRYGEFSVHEADEVGFVRKGESPLKAMLAFKVDSEHGVHSFQAVADLKGNVFVYFGSDDAGVIRHYAVEPLFPDLRFDATQVKASGIGRTDLQSLSGVRFPTGGELFSDRDLEALGKVPIETDENDPEAEAKSQAALDASVASLLRSRLKNWPVSIYSAVTHQGGPRLFTSIKLSPYGLYLAKRSVDEPENRALLHLANRVLLNEYFEAHNRRQYFDGKPAPTELELAMFKVRLVNECSFVKDSVASGELVKKAVSLSLSDDGLLVVVATQEDRDGKLEWKIGTGREFKLKSFEATGDPPSWTRNLFANRELVGSDMSRSGGRDHALRVRLKVVMVTPSVDSTGGWDVAGTSTVQVDSAKSREFSVTGHVSRNGKFQINYSEGSGLAGYFEDNGDLIGRVSNKMADGSFTTLGDVRLSPEVANGG